MKICSLGSAGLLALLVGFVVGGAPFGGPAEAATNCNSGKAISFDFEKGGTALLPAELAKLRSSLSGNCAWLLSVYAGDAPAGNIERRRNTILASKRIQGLKRLDFVRQKGGAIMFDDPKVARNEGRQGTLRALPFPGSAANCRSGGKTLRVGVNGEEIVPSAALSSFVRQANQGSCVIRVNGFSALNTLAFRGSAHDEMRAVINRRIVKMNSVLQQSGVRDDFILKGSVRVLNSRRANFRQPDYMLLEIM